MKLVKETDSILYKRCDPFDFNEPIMDPYELVEVLVVLPVLLLVVEVVVVLLFVAVLLVLLLVVLLKYNRNKI